MARRAWRATANGLEATAAEAARTTCRSRPSAGRPGWRFSTRQANSLSSTSAPKVQVTRPAPSTVLKAMRVALDALGAGNDQLVARDALRQRAAGHPGDPGIAFALGWLAGCDEATTAAAAAALAPLVRRRRVWR